MKYAVLGAGGFIGTNLTKYLLSVSDYNEVIAVDNNLTGNLLRLQEVVTYPGLNRLRTIQGDICKESTYEEIEKVDVIYNLACPASPIQYQSYPIDTIKACTEGLFKSLQYAERSGAMYFHTSTSEVYGDPDEDHHPQRESYHGNVNTWGPRASYDEAKRLAETICYEFKNVVKIRVARIFNTYGPYMMYNDGRVVSNFILQALAGKDIT
ncbi:MAG: NAD-dependent epimerase/dehydratase family protein, partial [Candidatus Dormibacteria bacterium]